MDVTKAREGIDDREIERRQSRHGKDLNPVRKSAFERRQLGRGSARLCGRDKSRRSIRKMTGAEISSQLPHEAGLPSRIAF